MEPTSLEQQAISLIKRSKKILILPSTPPDGDSLGGALALYLALKKIGKEVTAVCHDPIPEIYTFLPHEAVILNKINLNRDFIVTLDCSKSKVDHIRYNVEHNKVNIVISPKKGGFTDKNVSFHHGTIKYDLIIVVDAGDISQVGTIYEENPSLFYEVPVLNIDHHASNNDFGKVNLVDVTASATTEILYPFLRHLDETRNLIDEEIATLLLAGIITDTGSFQNANTTPKALEISAELVDLGANQQEIIKNVYKTKKLSTLKLWGRLLSKVSFDPRTKFLWSILQEKDFKETESEYAETGDVIDNLLVNTPEAEVVLLMKEKGPNLLSGSLRTTSPAIDANKIAEIFGGGGHTRAAGFKIPTQDIAKTELEVVEKIKHYQAKRLNLVQEEELEAKEWPEEEQLSPAKNFSATDQEKTLIENKNIEPLTEKKKEIRVEEVFAPAEKQSEKKVNIDKIFDDIFTPKKEEQKPVEKKIEIKSPQSASSSTVLFNSDLTAIIPPTPIDSTPKMSPLPAQPTPLIPPSILTIQSPPIETIPTSQPEATVTPVAPKKEESPTPPTPPKTSNIPDWLKGDDIDQVSY